MRKPISRLSKQTGLPSHQTGLQADLPGLGFDLHPNPSPSPNKPVGVGASPFCKPKTSLSSAGSASDKESMTHSTLHMGSVSFVFRTYTILHVIQTMRIHERRLKYTWVKRSHVHSGREPIISLPMAPHQPQSQNLAS
jgi:hypothetical protein